MDRGKDQHGDMSGKLSRLLRRIDDRVGRLIADKSDRIPEKAAADIGTDTAELQSLLDLLIQPQQNAVAQRSTDLNSTLIDCVRSELEAGAHPLQIQKQLTDHVLVVRCPRDDLRALICRALKIAADHTGHGGCIQVSTCVRSSQACLDLMCSGNNSGNHRLQDRSATLRDLVSQFSGHCEAIIGDDGTMHLRMILPTDDGSELE